ncbi:MAG: phenylalanine--tRNA ligase subunit alpha [Patescibacteria group bacterium]|jgi:phenylalanyl-tRNA synthetase alpha chain
MKDLIKNLQQKAQDEIHKAATNENLRDLEAKFLGRKGELADIMSKLKDLSSEERRVMGQLANSLKQELGDMFSLARKKFSLSGAEKRSRLDSTWPGEAQERGHLHPLTQFMRRVEDIFMSLGFEVLDGQEVETPEYNFDLLNIPKDHPARDMWDTYYLENGLLLRTHTSPMQLRAMEKRKPPVRLLIPGRTFRHEATDASHESVFYQYEGLVIDKCITVANLIATLKDFFQALYGKEVKVLPRSTFFPFTEPSLEITMSCLICGGKGCSVCKKTGWLEMLGAGMVHPQVLRNMKVDPEEYSGFAFGGGLERLMMLYHGINEIRLLYGGDLKFLGQF